MRHANRSLKNLCAGTGVQLICIRPTSQSRTKTKRVPRNPVFHNCSCKAPPHTCVIRRTFLLAHSVFVEYQVIADTTTTELPRESPRGDVFGANIRPMHFDSFVYIFIYFEKYACIYSIRIFLPEIFIWSPSRWQHWSLIDSWAKEKEDEKDFTRGVLGIFLFAWAGYVNL